MSTREDNLTTAANLRAWAGHALNSAKNSDASADGYQDEADAYRAQAAQSRTLAARYETAAAVLEAYDGDV